MQSPIASPFTPIKKSSKQSLKQTHSAVQRSLRTPQKDGEETTEEEEQEEKKEEQHNISLEEILCLLLKPVRFIAISGDQFGGSSSYTSSKEQQESEMKRSYLKGLVFHRDRQYLQALKSYAIVFNQPFVLRDSSDHSNLHLEGSPSRGLHDDSIKLPCVFAKKTVKGLVALSAFPSNSSQQPKTPTRSLDFSSLQNYTIVVNASPPQSSIEALLYLSKKNSAKIYEVN